MPSNAGHGPLVLLGESGAASLTELGPELFPATGGEVVVLPTAAAYERPERVLASLGELLGSLGLVLSPAMVLSRHDAEDEALVTTVSAARALYLVGGSSLHLRSVLKDSSLLAGIVSAWHSGAVVAGSGAGAVALSDPMVDPRGGAFTVGLGLVRNLAVVSAPSTELTPQLKRTLALAPSSVAILVLGPKACVVREMNGSWASRGRGDYAVYLDGAASDLEALAGKATA